MLQNITTDSQDRWYIARNIRKLAIEHEPETRKSEKLHLNLMTPSIE
jgi:hypothetical protein